MRTKDPQIEHQYDVWHFAKVVTKRLVARGKQKNCEEFLPWMHCITNPIWWSAASCGGNVDLLKDKWLFIDGQVPVCF
jgi:hypothetical protein